MNQTLKKIPLTAFLLFSVITAYVSSEKVPVSVVPATASQPAPNGEAARWMANERVWQPTVQKRTALHGSALRPPADADCHCSSNKYNCADVSRAEAQRIYDCCKKAVGYDVHKLDGDRDGRACEAKRQEPPDDRIFSKE